MPRFLLVASALFIFALPARADRMAPIAKPTERALRSPVVVVGKVTAIEKDPVDEALYPGAPQKVPHKIAVVKVETNLVGAENVTHLKVGFVPAGAGGRRGPENPDLKEGEEWLFFLTPHHSGSFQAIPYLTPPVNSTDGTFKADVEAVKNILAVVADPAKAFKAEKAEDRFAAAIAIIYKLRTPPTWSAKGYEPVALTADESRPILKALAEGSWKATRTSDDGLGGYASFARLALTEADGWKPPAVQAGQDFFEQTRQAYAKWLDGPGKDYRIKKYVAKK
jgi:hypothetical protein